MRRMDLFKLRKNILEKEKGTIFKSAKWRCLLLSPLPYRAGSTGLAMHILYREINKLPDCSCERGFFAEEIRSLENDRLPMEFHLLAFSLSFELDSLNFLKMLEMSQIPLLREERREEHPIVLVGGAFPTINPFPLFRFADAIAIGEGEEMVREIMEVLQKGKDRNERLHLLSNVEGIYVPGVSKSIRRRWLKDLNLYDGSSQYISPLAEFPSTVFIEVARGCPWRCRFCVVPSSFSPYRERSAEEIISSASRWKGIARKVALVGTAVSNHSQIEEIAKRLYEKGIPFSAASLRADALEESFLYYMAKGGEKTITLAPEVASPRLRRLINKHINEEITRDALFKAKRAGFQRARLYFMIGLPGESIEEVLAIADMASDLKQILPLHLSIASFVPKRGTPLESAQMEDPKTLERKVKLLKEALSKEGIPAAFESVKQSVIQSLLAKGDEAMGDVLLRAYREGGNYSAWMRALERSDMPSFQKGKRRAIFLDRDGVINLNRPDYVKTWEEFHFYPFSKPALALLASTPFLIIVATNQSCIGRGIVKKETVEEINERMKREIEEAGGRIDAIYYCPHRPNEGCPCRKPRPGLLLQAEKEWGIDLKRSYFIGDAMTDIEAGKRVGCTSILLLTGQGKSELPKILTAPFQPDRIEPDLLSAVEWIFKREGLK